MSWSSIVNIIITTKEFINLWAGSLSQNTTLMTMQKFNALNGLAGCSNPITD